MVTSNVLITEVVILLSSVIKRRGECLLFNYNYFIFDIKRLDKVKTFVRGELRILTSFKKSCLPFFSYSPFLYSGYIQE